jgi:hypothetical protein
VVGATAAQNVGLYRRPLPIARRPAAPSAAGVETWKRKFPALICGRQIGSGRAAHPESLATRSAKRAATGLRVQGDRQRRGEGRKPVARRALAGRKNWKAPENTLPIIEVAFASGGSSDRGAEAARPIAVLGWSVAEVHERS